MEQAYKEILPSQDKKPLILLHGLFGELSNWDHVINGFTKGYDVHTPSLPLFETHPGTTQLNGLVAFLENYIKKHSLSNPVLAGNSLGGHVALLYTLKHPNNVDSLVLTGSSGLYENTFGNSFPRVNDFDYIRSKIFEVFHKKEVVSDRLVNKVFETVNNRHKALSVIKIARDAKRQNLKKELHKINVPVLLIWGMQDHITPISVAEEFYLSLKRAKLHLINDCGHAPMMEQPVEFNKILGHFLSSNVLKVV